MRRKLHWWGKVNYDYINCCNNAWLTNLTDWLITSSSSSSSFIFFFFFSSSSSDQTSTLKFCFGNKNFVHDHSLPHACSTEVKTEGSYTSTPPMYPPDVSRDILPFFILTKASGFYGCAHTPNPCPALYLQVTHTKQIIILLHSLVFTFPDITRRGTMFPITLQQAFAKFLISAWYSRQHHFNNPTVSSPSIRIPTHFSKNLLTNFITWCRRKVKITC
jgi:hypothetical protein